MTDEELIARLREARKKQDEFEAVMLSDAAADRIEALVKERDKAALWATEQHACADNYALRLGQEKARAERLEAAMRGLMMHEPDHPDTLWQDARAALKGADHE